MNRGKRHIRNTFLALVGLTVLFPAASRIHASVVSPDTPAWISGLVSLGQTVKVNRTPWQMKAVRIEEAGQLLFNRVSVQGEFPVELVAAPVHKVTLVGGQGQSQGVNVIGQQDGLLLLRGDPGLRGVVLRIEAPAVASINAMNLPQLTIRGFNAPQLMVSTSNVARISLEENNIERWSLSAEPTVLVEADEATIATGLNIQARGGMDLLGAGGQKINLRSNSGGTFSVRSGK